MVILFIVLIILASVILGMIVLIQNPKGGGLTGNIAGFGNQFMGVKQTTDVLEKGTWIFAAIIAILCLTSSLFIRGSTGGSEIQISAPPPPAGSGPQQNTFPVPGTANPGDTAR